MSKKFIRKNLLNYRRNNFKISKDLQPLDLIWYQVNLSDSNFEGVIEKLKSINIDSFEKDLQLARVGATSIQPRQIISTIINNVESFRRMLKEKKNIAIKNDINALDRVAKVSLISSPWVR